MIGCGKRIQKITRVATKLIVYKVYGPSMVVMMLMIILLYFRLRQMTTPASITSLYRNTETVSELAGNVPKRMDGVVLYMYTLGGPACLPNLIIIHVTPEHKKRLFLFSFFFLFPSFTT